MAELKKEYSKYVVLVILLAIIYCSYLVLKDLMGAIILAVVLSYIFYPFYAWLVKKIKFKSLAAIITIFLQIFLILLPTAVITSAVVDQTKQAYNEIRVNLNDESNFCEGDTVSLLCQTYHTSANFLSTYGLDTSFKQGLIYAGKRISEFSSTLLLSLPKKAFHFFLMLFIMFYLFIDGKKLFKIISNLIPLDKKHKDNIIKQVNDTTFAVVYGQLVIAIVQGILATVIFLILGVPHSLFWGFIMIILGVLPMIGVSIVWMPVVIYFITSGINTDQNILIIKGIILLILYFIIITPMELILKPKVIGDRAKIHSLIIFLGVLGGLSFFGVVGLILGPVILSTLVIMIRIYQK